VLRDGVPVVWALHEHLDPAAHLMISTPRQRPNPYVQARMVAALGEATAVFAAEATCALYIAAGAVDATRTAIVPYGVEVPPAGGRERTRGDDAFLLVCVGRFEPRKSQTRLVEAVALLRAEMPDLRLALVGAGDDETTSTVRALVAAHGLGDVVELVPIGPPWEWYAAADAVVSASDLESMPYVLLEAMKVGVPVLAASVAGVPELVRDGDTGILFDDRDLGALVDAIRRMRAMDSHERQAMGERGRDAVEGRFELEPAVAALEGLLRAAT
jgi:glycosyltransferase involved in cell wall biosynthesis